MLVSRGKEGFTMNNLLWMLGNPPANDTPSLINGDTAEQFWNTLQPIITTVLWVIVGVLAVVLLIKGITTALAVVKAADEPQVRQEKIGSFKFMAIGVVIAMVIIAVMNIVLGLAKDKFLEGFKTTFLF